MNWPITIGIVAVFVVFVVFVVIKRLSFVSVEVARKHLAAGALVIDVRSPEEFRNGQVPGAINLPLGDLRESLPRRVKDQNQVLLVHCLSGGRSGIAKQQIKGMGYSNVFNLGSLARARMICDPASGK